MSFKFNPFTSKFDIVETDHTKLSNIGTNTHAQIDTALGTTIPATYLKLDASNDPITGNIMIDGSADAIQLTVQGHSTQTSNLQEWQNSAGTVIGGISGLGYAAFGTTPTANFVLETSNTKTANTGFLTANKFQLFNAPTASSNATYIAAWYRCFSTGAQNITGSMVGQYNEVVHQSTGTLNLSYGAQYSVKMDTTGGNIYRAAGVVASTNTGANSASLITNSYGFWADSPSFGAGATTTITNAMGVIISNMGSAKVTNAYGLYIVSQSSATTLNYAIYTNAGLNRFGDQIFIDGSADRIQLKVQGHSTQTTNLQEWQTSAAGVVASLDNSGNFVSIADIKGATYHVGASAGVDGSFTTADSKTVTVTKGIITAIV